MGSKGSFKFESTCLLLHVSQEIPKCLCVTVCLRLSDCVSSSLYVKVFMSLWSSDTARRDSSH